MPWLNARLYQIACPLLNTEDAQLGSFGFSILALRFPQILKTAANWTNAVYFTGTTHNLVDTKLPERAPAPSAQGGHYRSAAPPAPRRYGHPRLQAQARRAPRSRRKWRKAGAMAEVADGSQPEGEGSGAARVRRAAVLAAAGGTRAAAVASPCRLPGNRQRPGGSGRRMSGMPQPEALRRRRRRNGSG